MILVEAIATVTLVACAAAAATLFISFFWGGSK